MGGSGVATETTAAEAASLVGERLRAEGQGHAIPRELAGAEATPAFAVRLRVGRLLEVQVWHLRTIEVKRMLTECIEREARLAPSRAIIFADYRWTSPFSQEVGDEWARAMRSFNEHVACSAILVSSTNQTFNLQLERVVRCAGNPRRKLFYDKVELCDWLGARTTTAELARVGQLLRERP